MNFESQIEQPSRCCGLLRKDTGECLSVFTVPLLPGKPRYNSLLPIIFRGVNTTYAENEDIKCH